MKCQPTQNEAIKEHLESHGHISPMEALQKFGCFRLAARIDDLRKTGMDIETITEKRNGKKYARYVMRGQTSLFAGAT